MSYVQKVVIGDATLYQGDCMDILPTLPACHHVITDPPYEAEAHTKGRCVSGKQDNGERSVEMAALDFEAMTPELRHTCSSAAAAICSGWMLAFCQAEAVAAWRESHELAGAKYKRAMIWIKPDGSPQFTGDRPGMGYESIVASWCGKGRSTWNGGGRHGVFTHPHRESNNPKQHMTQKPSTLMRELVVLFSDPGQIILDPFMGSGTTGVACMQTGRGFIGIEREPKYFDIACKRIEQAHAQGQLFAPERPKQEQEALI